MLSKIYKIISVIVVEFSILLSISADSINWRDTGSLFKVEDVRVSSCNRTKCTVERGREYIIEVAFIATFPVNDLLFKITASKYGFTFPLLDGNLCDRGDAIGKLVYGKCPVEEGERLLYKYSAKVPHLIPAISGTVNGKVYDGDKVLMRISADIEVSKSPSSGKFDLFSWFKRTRSAPTVEPN